MSDRGRTDAYGNSSSNDTFGPEGAPTRKDGDDTQDQRSSGTPPAEAAKPSGTDAPRDATWAELLERLEGKLNDYATDDGSYWNREHESFLVALRAALRCLVARDAWKREAEEPSKYGTLARAEQDCDHAERDCRKKVLQLIAGAK